MPTTNFAHSDPYSYQVGFDSYHEYASNIRMSVQNN